MTTEASMAEVRAAVRKYVADELSWVSMPDMREAIGRELAIDFCARRTGGASPWDRLGGQVSRALNEMAAGGTLIKNSDGNSAIYWTPEAKARHEAEQRAREAERQRRAALHRHLAALGLAGGRFSDAGHGQVQVDLAVLEKLAELALQGGTGQEGGA